MRVVLTALALMAFAFFLNLLGDLSARPSTPQAPALAASVRAPIIPERATPPDAVAPQPSPRREFRAPARRASPAHPIAARPAPSLEALEAKPQPAKRARVKLAASPARPATPEAAKYAPPAPKALAALSADKRAAAALNPQADENPA